MDQATNWADQANVARAIGAISDAMEANRGINLLEWMQALRATHAAVREQVGESIADLAASRLDEHDDEQPARREAEEHGGDE